MKEHWNLRLNLWDDGSKCNSLCRFFFFFQGFQLVIQSGHTHDIGHVKLNKYIFKNVVIFKAQLRLSHMESANSIKLTTFLQVFSNEFNCSHHFGGFSCNHILSTVEYLLQYFQLGEVEFVFNADHFDHIFQPPIFITWLSRTHCSFLTSHNGISVK